MSPAVVGGLIRRGTRSRGVLAWVLACVLSAGAGAAAVWQLLGPGAPATEVAAEPSTYAVQDGSVGRTASYTVHAERDRVLLGVVAASGVVTGHGVGTGAAAESGVVLLRVDERPVVLLDGAVPTYRDMAAGLEGEDVRQLQEHLRTRGLLRQAADGTFGPATGSAVRAWQRSLGVEPDGVVRAGDVVFSTGLPGWVHLDETVSLGARVEPGMPLGTVQVGDPAFALVTEDAQRQLPGPAEQVTVVSGEIGWTAVTGTAVTDTDGRVRVPLVAPDGGVVCGQECGSVPAAEGVVLLTAQVDVVPTTHGPVVPVAALQTGAGGEVFVLLASGRQVEVHVLAEDGGRAVVAGVEPGAVVVLPEEGLS